MKSLRIEESTLRDWWVREDLRIETGFEHAVTARLRNLFRSHIDLFLLAFLPYTFFLLIQAPPYSWMPWFVRHPATLYSVAANTAVAANWPLREACAKREHRFLIGAGLLLAAGVYLSLHPFLRVLEDNRTAYSWSRASLLPLIAFALWCQVGDRPVEQNGPENGQLGYPKAADCGRGLGHLHGGIEDASLQ